MILSHPADSVGVSHVGHANSWLGNDMDLIGSSEAARRLGKSSRTIHRLVASGELVPVVTAPGGQAGAFLFDPADIDRIAGAAA